MAKELSFPPRTDCALLTVDTKPEALLQELGEAPHQTLPGLLRANVYVAVVCIAAKAVDSLLQLLVESVEKKIRQKQRERPALWRPLIAAYADAV